MADPVAGYQGSMSESTPDNESGTTKDSPAQGLISDEQLPDDLRPDKNPMAEEPDDDADGDSGPGGPATGGPDSSQPG